MSKKSSSVILKEKIKNSKKFSILYSTFKKKLDNFKKKVFLIAVSGGPDSLALTALAKFYSYEYKCKIYFVLINHNLRKKSSTEALSVQKLLKKHGISLVILNNNIQIKRNIQSKAREIRYNLLSSYCKKKKVKIIITAHNLEDQVETFFIRLSRGSGLHGLSSMKEIYKINKNINLVRPLLSFEKKELIELSRKIFGKFYKDPSNKNTKFLRTRIRGLKKHLEKSGINYNQIFNSIQNLASSRDTLDLYFNKIYLDTVIKRKNRIIIKINSFKKLNSEMKMRVFEKSFKDLTRSYYSPRSKKIINLVDKVESSKNTKFTLAGCLVFREKNQLILTREIKN